VVRGVFGADPWSREAGGAEGSHRAGRGGRGEEWGAHWRRARRGDVGLLRLLLDGRKPRGDESPAAGGEAVAEVVRRPSELKTRSSWAPRRTLGGEAPGLVPAVPEKRRRGALRRLRKAPTAKRRPISTTGRDRATFLCGFEYLGVRETLFACLGIQGLRCLAATNYARAISIDAHLSAIEVRCVVRVSAGRKAAQLIDLFNGAAPFEGEESARGGAEYLRRLRSRLRTSRPRADCTPPASPTRPSTTP